MSTPIRVLIADDHEIVREGLAAIIGRQPDMEVVGEADDGKSTVQSWFVHRPDVALIDLRMPEGDGVAVIEQVRSRESAARFIVLTTYDADEAVYQAVRAGARGYLLKDTAREALLDAIRRVHEGQTCLPAAMAAKLADQVSGERLTEREQDVLDLLAQGNSNKEIAARLNIGEATVKSHLKNVFAKLNVLSRTEAVTVANRRGLVRSWPE